MAESWVRVESEGELRAGMAVHWTPSMVLHRNVTLVLLRPISDGLCPECGPVTAWDVGDDEGWCVTAAIREGRLYRMALDEPAAEETERTRERERTR